MVEEISREMNIPRSFLAKILQKLAKTKIVRSHRGIKGGFTLARKPKDINIYDVVMAIEGPIAVNVCAVNKKLCDMSDRCRIHPVWVEVRREIEKILRKRDFQKLKL